MHSARRLALVLPTLKEVEDTPLEPLPNIVLFRELEMKRERLGGERMEREDEDEGVSPPPSKRMNREGSESPPAIVANVAVESDGR